MSEEVVTADEFEAMGPWQHQVVDELEKASKIWEKNDG